MYITETLIIIKIPYIKHTINYIIFFFILLILILNLILPITSPLKLIFIIVMYNFTKFIFPHSSVPLLRYFRYLRHSVILFMFRSVYVSSCQLSYLHYLSPLGSGRILHRSCCVLIVHNVSTFLSFILPLYHYSVYLRYCYPFPYISVIVLWHQYPLGYWYPRPFLLFRSVYKPDKLVVVLQFVINLISLTLSYSKPLFLLKSHSSSSSLSSPSPLRLSGTYPVTPFQPPYLRNSVNQ
jgi:hypothetical protein